jgi:outer membrane protein OmpU
MKKVLFATSALVASAGIASAEIQGSSNITLSGSAQMGVIYTENDATDTDWVVQKEVDLGVSMSSATDGGLGFGASFNISGDGGGTEDANVFVSGAFGTLTIGDDIGEANRRGGIADVGYDGLGVDDVVEDNQELTSANVGYSYTAGALTVGFSMTSDTNEAAPYAVGFTYKAGGMDFSVGYADNDDGAADTTAVTVAAGYTTGAFTIDAMMTTSETSSVETEATGLSVAYAMDAATTITFAAADIDGSTDSSVGVGIAYDLGGGATFQAGAASVNDVSKASAGIAMAF